MQDTEHISFIADCLTNYKIKIHSACSVFRLVLARVRQ